MDWLLRLPLAAIGAAIVGRWLVNAARRRRPAAVHIPDGDGGRFIALDEDGLRRLRTLLPEAAGDARSPWNLVVGQRDPDASDYEWALTHAGAPWSASKLQAAIERIDREALAAGPGGRRTRLTRRANRLRWRLLESEWAAAYNWSRGETVFLQTLERPLSSEQYNLWRRRGVPARVLWAARAPGR